MNIKGTAIFLITLITLSCTVFVAGRVAIQNLTKTPVDATFVYINDETFKIPTLRIQPGETFEPVTSRYITKRKSNSYIQEVEGEKRLLVKFQRIDAQGHPIGSEIKTPEFDGTKPYLKDFVQKGDLFTFEDKEDIYITNMTTVPVSVRVVYPDNKKSLDLSNQLGFGELIKYSERTNQKLQIGFTPAGGKEVLTPTITKGNSFMAFFVQDEDKLFQFNVAYYKGIFIRNKTRWPVTFRVVNAKNGSDIYTHPVQINKGEALALEQGINIFGNNEDIRIVADIQNKNLVFFPIFNIKTPFLHSHDPFLADLIEDKKVEEKRGEIYFKFDIKTMLNRIEIKNKSGFPVKLKILDATKDTYGAEIGYSEVKGTTMKRPDWLEDGDTFYWAEEPGKNLIITVQGYSKDKTTSFPTTDYGRTITFLSNTPLVGSVLSGTFRGGQYFTFAYKVFVIGRQQVRNESQTREEWCKHHCQVWGARPYQSEGFKGKGEWLDTALTKIFGGNYPYDVCVCTEGPLVLTPWEPQHRWA